MKNDKPFLPDSYNVPEPLSKYFKFQEGENRFRIMSSPILGYEWWVDKDGNVRQKDQKPLKGDKPVRCPMDGIMPPDAGETYRHFWAMRVFNYKTETIQILQLTQRTIQKPLRALARDKDWGDPKGSSGYDIVVHKSGKGLETEYQVTPKPKKELDKGIVQLNADTYIKLEKLYKGLDPFKNEEVKEQK